MAFKVTCDTENYFEIRRYHVHWRKPTKDIEEKIYRNSDAAFRAVFRIGAVHVFIGPNRNFIGTKKFQNTLHMYRKYR